MSKNVVFMMDIDIKGDGGMLVAGEQLTNIQ